MDRRSTIAALVGKKTKASTAVAKQFSAPVIAGGMDPYTGPWNFEQAAHLLRRATFGPSLTQLKKAQQDGLNATLNKLFTPVNITGPLNSGQYLGQRDAMNQPPATNDPYVPVGQPWVKKEAGKWKAGWYDVRDTTTRNRIQAYRRQTLRSWILESIIKEETSIIQTMTLFWHNHFVTAETNDPVFEFRYLATLTDNCLGDFKELVKQITIDPAMLFYLNGNVNTGNSPNENYARELFELFTIGKGPLVGPGDYSNYTEDDIREAAKVLSGWRVYGLNATQIVSDKDANGGYFELENSKLSYFTNNRHNTTTKNFSHRFNNTSIANAGAEEYKHLVDMIFQQRECARFICRKLYRWFVYYEITPQAEADVIETMANILINNDYNIGAVVRALLRSEHFFNALNVGPMIKNPIDFVMTILKPFDYESKEPASLYDKLVFYYNGIRPVLITMQMEYLNPPDVAGWKAYYQEPSFYRIWINSVTLNSRMGYSKQLALSVNNQGRGNTNGVDVLAFVAGLDNNLDPNEMIDEITKILLPQPLTQVQKDYLKEILIPGLPDFEWTVEYGDYLANPNNADLRNAVQSKLRNLFHAIFSLPEFYLS